MLGPVQFAKPAAPEQRLDPIGVAKHDTHPQRPRSRSAAALRWHDRPLGAAANSHHRPLFGTGLATRGTHPVGPYLPADVLEGLLAHVVEGQIKLAGGVFLNAARDADPAGLSDAFKTGRDIDAVAEDVPVLFEDHVALVDTDAKYDAAVRRQRGIGFGHRALELGGATQCVDDAVELHQ